MHFAPDLHEKCFYSRKNDKAKSNYEFECAKRTLRDRNKIFIELCCHRLCTCMALILATPHCCRRLIRKLGTFPHFEHFACTSLTNISLCFSCVKSSHRFGDSELLIISLLAASRALRFASVICRRITNQNDMRRTICIREKSNERAVNSCG